MRRADVATMGIWNLSTYSARTSNNSKTDTAKKSRCENIKEKFQKNNANFTAIIKLRTLTVSNNYHPLITSLYYKIRKKSIIFYVCVQI